jgi:hypothetical protein
MPFSIHDIDLVDGSTPTMQDRLIGGLQLAVANAAGGSAGASVTVAVSFASPLPSNYAVFVDSGQVNVVGTVSARTSTGFTVTLTPLVSTVTVAAGSFNVSIVG